MSIIIDHDSLIGKRQSNEDKHVVFTNIDGNDPNKAQINIYAVFDGHGGKNISKFLHDFLPPILTDKRVKLPITKQFAVQCIQHLQDHLKHNMYNYAAEVGSTCLVVIHFKKNGIEHLNIINIGDSRCILCHNSMAIPLTLDHKPHYPSERERIKKIGGDILCDSAGDWRCEGLSLSRAVGDLNAYPYVTCTPDVYKYTLSYADKFIIVACDGLYEGIPDNQDIINFVLDNCYDIVTGERRNTKIATKLAQYAIERGSSDNISVIVIFLK
jgi:serine/threonine protein phosphatase PrpC